MGRNAGRSRGPGGRGGLKVWLALGVLAFAVGLLTAHLFRQLPERSLPTVVSSSELRVFNELLGPVRDGGFRVSVADRGAAVELEERIGEAARRSAQGKLAGREESEDRLEVRLELGTVSYPIEIRWPGEAPPRPRVAVVIDDMGRDLDQAASFLDLEIPVTIAILPYLSSSQEVASLARAREREYLLHLPMEPRGYPDVDPGEGALTRTMSEAEIRAMVAEDLAAVPGVSGVNNHMGSRLTELEEPMSLVMGELAKYGLYYLDSLTSGSSVAAQVAQRRGLRWARRDVFLDNVREEAAIGEQLKQAVARAKQNGQAVAIGHPHPATLKALQRWARTVGEQGVRVVPLKEVLRGADGA